MITKKIVFAKNLPPLRVKGILLPLVHQIGKIFTSFPAIIISVSNDFFDLLTYHWKATVHSISIFKWHLFFAFFQKFNKYCLVNAKKNHCSHSASDGIQLLLSQSAALKLTLCITKTSVNKGNRHKSCHRFNLNIKATHQ